MKRPSKRLPSAGEIDRTVGLFAALANPLRLRLLIALTRRGEQSAGELEVAVGAEQSAVSHQLAALRRNHLVVSRREGRRMIYDLLDHHVAHIVDDALAHANERLGDFPRARQFYAEVVRENPDSSFAALARKRLEALSP